MKFTFAVTSSALASTLATANGHRHTIRGLQEDDTMSMLLDESHKGSGSKSTTSRSQGGKVPKCNLEEFAGFWQAIDVDDASNLRASIKCFKDECTCNVVFSDDDATTVCGGGAYVSQQDYTYDSTSNALALTTDSNGICQDPGSDGESLGQTTYTLAEDGSLEFETTDGLFMTTFWKTSEGVDALPEREPAPTPVPTTLEPTKKPTPKLGDPGPSPMTPPGAVYYQSFENDDFPFFGVGDQDGDPSWSTANNDDPTKVWKKTNEEASTDSFSLKSPDLDTELKTTSSSNLTLTTPDFGVPGELFFSAWAGTQQPLDVFEWYVDGEQRGAIQNSRDGFESTPPGPIAVGPGKHRYDFVYTFNKFSIPPGGLPPDDFFRIGQVWFTSMMFTLYQMFNWSAVLE